MEETIDLDVQRDYYETTKNLSFEPKEEDLDQLLIELNEQNIALEQRKNVLIKLAMFDSVKAYRAIENYNKTPDENIKDWAILALQQSSMVMQSSLLDEQQVFISTGLGGKDNKLRYFLIFPYENTENLNQTVEQALKSELDFFIQKEEGSVEEIEFQNNFATAMVLMPLTANIPDMIQNILEECNQFGNFLSEDVMITNMKKFNATEILDIIEKHAKKEN